MTVGYSSGEAEKERRPQQKQVTFIQARRGDSQPNDQAERREGSGRRHTYREVCGSDKGHVNQAGYCVCVCGLLLNRFFFIYFY